MIHQIRRSRHFLTKHERDLVWAIASAALPAGQRFPSADRTVVDSVDAFVASMSPALKGAYRALLATLDRHALIRRRRRFNRGAYVATDSTGVGDSVLGAIGPSVNSMNV